MSIKQEFQYIKTSTSDVRSFGWMVGGVFLALWLVFIGSLPAIEQLPVPAVLSRLI